MTLPAQRISPSGPRVPGEPTPPALQAANYVLTGLNEFKPLFAAGEFPDIYVAPDGSDTENTGLTPASPFATIKAALMLSRVSAVASEIHVARGDYSPAGLDDPALVTPRQTIIGEDFDSLSDDATVSAYNSTGRIITFSPSPGWSANQWVGKMIQWQSGPSGPFPIPLEACALISQSTADTVTVTFPASLTQVPQAGDVMRVVEPAANIIDAESVLGPPGTLENGSSEPFRLQRNYRELKNLSFISSAPSTANIVFAGSFRFDALACYEYGEINMTGSCFAGSNPARTGRGLTALGTVHNPAVHCFSGGFRLYLVGGRFVAYAGAMCTWLGGFLRDLRTSHPHACLSTVGGQMLTFSQTVAGRLFIDGGVENSVNAEQGELYVTSPITHQGSGQFAEAQQMGIVTITRNPVVTGSNAALYAATGGQIRLTTADGATLGAATAGSSVALGRVTRAAAVWAAGDSVCGAANIPRDLSNIYRT